MQRWKLSALAAATLALSSLPATDALALALGRITVQSALGEPLRAEVEIPQLSAAEADSLQAAVASPAAFRAQGMEYSGTANTVRVKIQKRANGTAVLQLSSFQPVNDPFVDLVIDANWASGKLQRNYTLLLDPPTRRAAPAVTTAAQAAPAQVPPVQQVQQVQAPAQPTAAARPAPAPAAAAQGRDLRNDRDQVNASAKIQQKKQDKSKTATEEPSSAKGKVRVKTGDTAGRLAAAHKPASVSLDQMLVAMLRSNPQAFIGGNINRMRSGAVIQLPDEADAQATSVKEARKIMVAQSQDFNQFRRQLAGVAPTAPVEAASRSASGQVQAHVDDAKPSTAAPDKLTLSKGTVKGMTEDEKLAQQKQTANQAARADELKRNMAELSQIAAATKPAGNAAAATAAATGAASQTPGVNVPSATAASNAAATAPAAAAPSVAPATAAPEATPTPAPATPVEGAVPEAAKPVDVAGTPADSTGSAVATAPEAATPEPAAAVQPPKPAPAQVTPPQEPSFIDSLMEDPTIPLAGAALLALLLGYGGYRVMQRRKESAAGPDSTLGDSQLSPDSFFGASGGQRVDTSSNSSQLSAQSMQYSPSQLDAGDVDPLAEADVYLAYGRDLQAEEILKEALRNDPNRLVLHQKLAEIYAKRHDRMAYASVANNLYALTQGKGPEWQRLVDQGKILDPQNALYQPGGSPQANATSAINPASVLAAGAAAASFGSALAAQKDSDREGPATQPSAMDFDMELDLPGGMAPAPAPISAASVSQPNEQDFASLAQWDTPAATPAVATPAAADNGLNLDLNDLASFSLPGTTSQAATPVAAPAQENMSNALEFDLDSFTLPLQTTVENIEEIDTAPADLTVNHAAAAEEESHPTEAMTLQLPIDADSGFAQPASANPADVTFDLSGLSLDLGASNAAAEFPAAASPAQAADQLTTKLALAEEFNAIGDADGARSLIEEVIAEAHGDLKAKAQHLLTQIG